MWTHLTGHFTAFQNNIVLTADEHSDVWGKSERIGKALHARYYEGEYDPARLLLAGSYGRRTAIRPTSDVDLMFQMPETDLQRFNAYTTNGQSALLQEVRGVLRERFPRTDIRADGQVVIVDHESFMFEVLPVFYLQGRVWIPDTNDNGSWKEAFPKQEIAEMNALDLQTHGQARELTQYLKVWRRSKDIPIKSFMLEIAACCFLKQWPYLNNSIEYNNPEFWHDWLVRDFFEFLLKHDHVILRNGERVDFPDGWKTKTQEALNAAQYACHYEYTDNPILAVSYWRDIFGGQFPHHPTGIGHNSWASSSLLGAFSD